MSPARERAALLTLVGLVLLANLVTASRYPAVWVDEVQFADPAVNLVTGEGFTSSVWVKQGRAEVFAGNAPLYPLLLSGWLSLFGVSAVAVRSFNFVLVSVLALLFPAFLARSGLVRDPRLRLAAAALVLTAHGLTFSYRMGRYDVLGVVWAVLAALLWAGPATPLRLAGLFLTGLLLAPTGLQLVPATLLIVTLVLVFRGREDLPRAGALLVGLVGGGVLLRVAFGLLGVWEAFRASTGAVGVIGKGILAKVLDLPRVYLADKSLVFVALAALVLLVLAGKGALRAPRLSPLLFGLAALAVVPSALQVAAKFPVYYSWMALLPLLSGVLSTLDTQRLPAAGSGAAGALLCAAALFGLPLRLAVLGTVWEAKDPARLAADLAERIGPDDVVVTDFKGYYVVKSRAKGLYGLPYLGIMTPEEKAAVTALLLRPSTLGFVTAAVGGGWAPEGTEIAAGSVRPEPSLFALTRELREENEPLQVYRRAP